jgi:ADP-heptose:LPS heptosyltransferase
VIDRPACGCSSSSAQARRPAAGTAGDRARQSIAPDAQIHPLANDYNAWVARDHPALTRTWVTRACGRPPRASLAALRQIPLQWQLRRQRFDWRSSWAVTNRIARSGAIAPAHGASSRTRRTRAVWSMLTDLLAPPAGGHEMQRMLALLAPLAQSLGERRADIAPADAAPTFTLSDETCAHAAHWLRRPRRGATSSSGSARDARKTAERRPGRAGRRAHSRRGGLPSADVDAARRTSRIRATTLAQAVLDRNLAHVHPFRGPIDPALGLIFSARTSVVPDSGLMHFAAASDGGVLGLFADPLDSAPASRWAPLGPRAFYVEAPKRIADVADDDVFRMLDPLLD